MTLFSAVGIVAGVAAGASGPHCAGWSFGFATVVPASFGVVGLLFNGRMLELASATALAAWAVTGPANVAPGPVPAGTYLALWSAGGAGAGLLMLAAGHRFPSEPSPSWYQRGGWIAIAVLLAAVLYVIAWGIAFSISFSACFYLGPGI